MIKKELPKTHIVCGLSNVSFGLPVRKLLNRSFLASAMTLGLDAAILDPLDMSLMAQATATSAVLGQDEYCMDYLVKYRNGKLL